MNASLKLPAPVTIAEWQNTATTELKKVGISSARLDTLILLEYVLSKDRLWIISHDEQKITEPQFSLLNKYLAQRIKRIPLAYVRGFVDFYDQAYTVTPEVLIPRPESEEIIELSIKYAKPGNHIIDVGTGSGAIAISIKKQMPQIRMEASDISKSALAIAALNAKNLHASVTFLQSDLLASANTHYDMIIANLPYVAKNYDISPDAKYEPAMALFAEDDGYHLIEKLLPQAAQSLVSGGYLLLESNPWQQERIINKAVTLGFRAIENRRFHLVLQREIRAI